MSNKINLDLLADTSQAQKAISDLTRDVDKLQKKAASTQFKGAPTSSQATKEKTTRQVTDAKAAKGQYGKGLDTSALKSAFATLTGQLSSFAGGLTNAASALTTLSDTAILVNQSFQAMKAASKALNKARRRAARTSEVSTETERGRERLKVLTNTRKGYERWKEGDFSRIRYNLSEEDKRHARSFAARNYDQTIAAERRQLMQNVWRDTYGPRDTKGERLTPGQLWNRGRLQMSGGRVAGNALSPTGYAIRGGKLAGLGNMALAGAAFTGQSFANVGRSAGGLLARGAGAMGRGVMAVGRGIGALGSGAMAALANPYVAGAAAGVATVALSLIHI